MTKYIIIKPMTISVIFPNHIASQIGSTSFVARTWPKASNNQYIVAKPKASPTPIDFSLLLVVMARGSPISTKARLAKELAILL